MRRIPVYITPAEAHRILELTSGKEQLLIALLWYTGGRVSEVLALRAGDVTDTGIVMPNLKQRSPELKHVILPRKFLARLKQEIADMAPQQLLFPSPRQPDRPASRVWAWRVVKRAAAKAGILKGRYDERLPTAAWPHTFRHGYATALLLQGAPLTAVQQQLGHKKIEHTAVYTQIADPHLQAMLEDLEL